MRWLELLLKHPEAAVAIVGTCATVFGGLAGRLMGANSATKKLARKVEEELAPNSGKSLRDVVDRIEEQGATTQRQVADIAADESACRVHYPFGLWRTDDKGYVVSVNEKWLEIMGSTAESAMGTGWLNCLESSEVEQIERQLDQCLDGQRTFFASARTRKGSTVKLRLDPFVHGWHGTVIRNGALDPELAKQARDFLEREHHRYHERGPEKE